MDTATAWLFCSIIELANFSKSRFKNSWRIVFHIAIALVTDF